MHVKEAPPQAKLSREYAENLLEFDLKFYVIFIIYSTLFGGAIDRIELEELYIHVYKLHMVIICERCHSANCRREQFKCMRMCKADICVWLACLLHCLYFIINYILACT